MNLTISETGIALIKKYEGCRLTAYKCPAGIWTVGYGHTSGVKEGMKITQAQAEAYLKSDCAGAEKAVNGYLPVYHWTQNQFDALVSFTFNCGSGNLHTLLAGGKRTIEEISEKILLYNKGDGATLPGLVKRRKEEKELFDQAACHAASPSGTSGNSSDNKLTTLTVDGLWGTNTTKRLQQIFQTTADGIVSNQLMSEKRRNPGLAGQSGWDWKTNPAKGSPLIAAIQKETGVIQDGWLGKKTIRAMQKWLGTAQDGVISNPSAMVKALQTWCNNQPK
ncbi:MAG: lysozyme [Lachnospiraceae bacterium]